MPTQDPFVSPKRMTILTLLIEMNRPLYGSEIIQLSLEEGLISISRDEVYSILQRMQIDRLVLAKLAKQKNNRDLRVKRKYEPMPMGRLAHASTKAGMMVWNSGMTDLLKMGNDIKF